MPKQIQLSQGKFALVDDEDFEKINQYKWHYDNNRRRDGYAVAQTGYKGKKIYMHRFIVNAQKEQEIDHIDGNKLNNQKSNLRVVTRSQNNYNQRPQINASSKFKGVTWHKKAQKWMATIHTKDNKIYLGVFTEEAEAAKAYNKIAKELFGEYARLNEI